MGEKGEGGPVGGLQTDTSCPVNLFFTFRYEKKIKRLETKGKKRKHYGTAVRTAVRSLVSVPEVLQGQQVVGY